MATSINRKDLVSLYDLTVEEIYTIFRLAETLKMDNLSKKPHHLLKGKTLGMIFQKPSTRTRVSFEVGIYQLGGSALYLSGNDLQLNRGETIADTARTLSRYVDGIMARVFSHNDIINLAKYSSVPVINGLSDFSHPCQGLTDFYSIYEKRHSLSNLKLAYVGDGNNVAHSLIFGAAKLGINIALACPAGYEPNPDVIEKAKKDAYNTGAYIQVTHDPEAAVISADIIYTDVWTSMGQETEKDKRLAMFKAYQINNELIKKANPDYLFMHCLPAHRGEEVTDEIIDGPNSICFDQAENRLHIQKAIMALLM